VGQFEPHKSTACHRHPADDFGSLSSLNVIDRIQSILDRFLSFVGQGEHIVGGTAKQMAEASNFEWCCHHARFLFL
jgi:hypothetical protein